MTDPAKGSSAPVRTGSIVSTIIGDIHFWIPLIVLIAGLFFLHQLH
ncbi:MAG TPA: translocated intimin receptor Tir [Terriglobales bacterium]|nr:translocated intimin receptor Tir [Terriglobales bacterium]